MNAETLKACWSLILEERYWSWTVPVILYLALAMMIRGIMLSPLVAYSKAQTARYFNSMKEYYLRRAFLGWCFFYLPAVLIAILWFRTAHHSFSAEDLALAGAAGFSFVWAVILHLRSLGFAALEVVRDLAVEKETYEMLKPKA